MAGRGAGKNLEEEDIMEIKLICVNENCKYAYTVSENELKEYGQYHKQCLICGSKLVVAKESLVEIVKKDLYTKAEEFINKWVSEIGWDRTLDLIKNNDNQACYRIYKDILKKKGFTLKGE